MNTLHFKYAVEVERTRSITQAAENLFMAQPNLSKAIKELEDTVGIEIFERTPKGVIPTIKGAEFLVYAKNVIGQLKKMEHLHRKEEAKRQNFKISIPRGSYISSAFTRFAAELDVEKEINVSAKETNSMKAISNITEKNFPLGIIRYPTEYENYFLDYIEDKQLVSEPIWEFEYVVLMSRKHPLAASAKVTFDELIQGIEIANDDKVVPYLPANRIKKYETKKRIYVYERCGQFELLFNIPKSYMWVSPIQENILNMYGLVQRKCHGIHHKYKDLLIYPKDYQFSALDNKFIDHLYASKNEVAFRSYE